MESKWIDVKERIPKPKEWCWIWWEWENGEGYCDKMYLSTSNKWHKNALSQVKDEYFGYIKAWQPYYEPKPYKTRSK